MAIQNDLPDEIVGDAARELRPRRSAVGRAVNPLPRAFLVAVRREDDVGIRRVQDDIHRHDHGVDVVPGSAAVRGVVDALRGRRPHIVLVHRMHANPRNAALLVETPIENVAPAGPSVLGLQDADAIAAASRPVKDASMYVLITVDLTGAQIHHICVAFGNGNSGCRRNRKTYRHALPACIQALVVRPPKASAGRTNPN